VPLLRVCGKLLPLTKSQLINNYKSIISPSHEVWPLIETRHLPPSIKKSTTIKDSDISTFRTLRQTEALMMERALRRNKGNRTAAARELGINPSTLFRKLKRLNIRSE
jgi:transcriptional regulator with PAS, ATPase and Fis domain